MAAIKLAKKADLAAENGARASADTALDARLDDAEASILSVERSRGTTLGVSSAVGTDIADDFDSNWGIDSEGLVYWESDPADVTPGEEAVLGTAPFGQLAVVQPTTDPGPEYTPVSQADLDDQLEEGIAAEAVLRAAGDTSMLDPATSKLLPGLLPPLALTNITVVASQAEQLALTAEEGDVAVRSDQPKSYVRNSGTAGTMADWTELLTPTDAVLSVAGRTGAVVLTKSDVGLPNVDNTSDASKPVSSAQQAALDAKAALAATASVLGGVKVTGTITDPASPVVASADDVERHILDADLNAGIASEVNPQDITGLGVAIGTSSTSIRVVRFHLLVDAANVTMDLALTWATFPSGATARFGVPQGVGASVTPLGMKNQSQTLSLGLAVGYNEILVVAHVFGGGTAGTVQLRYAQLVSDAGLLIIRKGSAVESVRYKP